MKHMETAYKQFDLRATAWESGGTFFSHVEVARAGCDPRTAIGIDVPIGPAGIGGRSEALEVAIDFGKAVVDGRVPGVGAPD